MSQIIFPDTLSVTFFLLLKLINILSVRVIVSSAILVGRVIRGVTFSDNYLFCSSSMYIVKQVYIKITT